MPRAGRGKAFGRGQAPGRGDAFGRGQAAGLWSEIQGVTSSEAAPVLNLDLAALGFGGLLLVLFYAPLARGLFFPQEVLPVQIAVAALAALVALQQLNKRQEPFPWTRPEDWLVLGFVAVYLAAFYLTAVDRREAIGETLHVAMYALAYFILSRTATTERRRNIVYDTLLLGGAAVAAVTVLSPLGLIPFPGALVAARLLGPFQYPNTLAAYSLVVLLLALARWTADRRWLMRGIMAYLASIAFILILGTQSRAVWVMTPVFLFVFILGLPARHWFRAVGAAGGTVVTGLVLSRRFYTALVTGAQAAPGSPQHTEALTQVLIYLALAGAVALAFDLLLYLYEQVLGWNEADRMERQRYGVLGALVLAGIGTVGGAFLLSTRGDVINWVIPAAFLRRFESVQFTDPSLLGRLDFSQDAIALIRQHPLLGTGGGGWNALYHQVQPYLYWTSEVHNGFLQVGVETGLIGLGLFLGLWILHTRNGWRVMWAARGHLTLRPAVITRWGLFLATLAFGVHALLDFDFSLPAMPLLLFALWGVQQGAIIEGLPARGRSVRAAGSPGGRGRQAEFSARVRRGQPASTQAGQPPQSPGVQAALSARAHPGQSAREQLAATAANPAQGPTPRPAIASDYVGSGGGIAAALQTIARAARVLLTTLIGLVLIAGSIAWSARLEAAGLAGARGARAIQREDWQTAEQNLKEAARLDPWTSNYAFDLAQLRAAVHLTEETDADREARLEEAAAWLEEAVRRQPYRLQLRLREPALWLRLNQEQKAVAAAKEAVTLLPRDPSAYSTWAATVLVAALREWDANRRIDPYAGELRELTTLPRRIRELQQEGERILAARRWHDAPKERRLEFTEELQLTVGQAHLLLGEEEEAAFYLEPLTGSPNLPLRREARVWQAAFHFKQGETPTEDWWFELREDEAARAQIERLAGRSLFNP